MKVALLGCGNMSRAIVTQVYNKNPSAYTFYTYTPSQIRAKELSEKLNGFFCAKISDIPVCDVYIIGCKPAQFDDLAKVLKIHLPKNSVVISIMAAIEEKILQEKLTISKVLRVMPSMPSEVGLGISLLFTSSLAENEKKLLEEFFVLSSKVYWCQTEKALEEGMILTACGPAYVYYFAQTLAQSFRKLNSDFSNETIDTLVRDLFIGSSTLMSNSSLSLSELVNSVTSKGGVTQKAIDVFANSLPDTTVLALNEALKQNKKLK